MTNSTSSSQWPGYLPLPREHIFALGVISLNYCQLENMFRSMFSAVAYWNEAQTAALFHRLPNNVRQDALSELLGKTTIPEAAKKMVEHFLSGLGLCADNRNLIMHSSSGGMFTDEKNNTRGLVLERFSKPGNRLVCHLTLEDLKKTADDIHAFTTFGAFALTEVTNYRTHLRSGRPDNYRPLPPTLRETPPLPTPLNWHSPADPKAHGIPPAALHLISAYRVQDV